MPCTHTVNTGQVYLFCCRYKAFLVTFAGAAPFLPPWVKLTKECGQFVGLSRLANNRTILLWVVFGDGLSDGLAKSLDLLFLLDEIFSARGEAPPRNKATGRFLDRKTSGMNNSASLPVLRKSPAAVELDLRSNWKQVQLPMATESYRVDSEASEELVWHTSHVAIWPWRSSERSRIERRSMR